MRGDRPKIPLTAELDRKHKGETIVVLGTANHVAKMDLAPLKNVTVVSCNRILQTPNARDVVNYLLVSDRRPYIEEMREGKYKAWASRIKMMFSTSMYDPHIRCHDTPVQKQPTDFKWYPWRVTGSKAAWNWTTLAKPLCSAANIGGPMLQAAVILGAKRIFFLGTGIVQPNTDGRNRHAYPDSKDGWLNPGSCSPPRTAECFAKAKSELDARGIEAFTMSPKKNPFDEIFPKYNYGKFVKKFCQ